MDVPLEDFPTDILHGWFIMIDQMRINRLFHHSDMFFYSGSNKIHDIRTRKIIEALEIREQENVMNACIGRIWTNTIKLISLANGISLLYQVFFFSHKPILYS